LDIRLHEANSRSISTSATMPSSCISIDRHINGNGVPTIPASIAK
jgi:hypothetical protein